MPIRISITRPIPFWPSLEPWAKLTPVQVRVRTPRIHRGGGESDFGEVYSSGWRMIRLAMSSNRAAPTKPRMGEMSRESPTSAALFQLTPSPKDLPGVRRELASPTPMIDPMSVCELDAGSPKYQVPRFQIMDESSRANTMANPAAVPTLRTSSTGRSETTPNATAPEEVRTPIRFHIPDQSTAWDGRNVRV